MTRNDAIVLVTNCTISSYDYQNLKHTVDRIYNDFEQQTCANCRFYLEDSNLTDVWTECRNSKSPLNYTSVEANFGCNLFEPCK